MSGTYISEALAENSLERFLIRYKIQQMHES